MNLIDQNDQFLVKQYIRGNERALELLLARHKTRIYSAIYFFVKDTCLAEDLFQETFIKVIKKLRSGTYKEEGKFLPWVLRIANNLCIDNYRKMKRKPTKVNPEGYDIFEVLVTSEKNVEDKIVDQEKAVFVKSVIDTLSVEQKEVVILRHYADLSFKEIADLTGVSINTALGRMRYALINMRKEIEENRLS